MALGSHKIAVSETPKIDWKMTGELVPTRDGPKPVYIETVPNLIKRQVTDNDGNPVYQKHPTTGQNIRPMTELVQDPDNPVLEREFILAHPGSTGMVWKNYNFRDTTPRKPEPADYDALLARVEQLEREKSDLVVPEAEAEEEWDWVEED